LINREACRNPFAQTQEAARFIVNNLNDGDLFNLISFSTAANVFSQSHVPFNEANKTAAINYINGLTAAGVTNIQAAFDAAVTQFSNSTGEYANIIIFMTDGEPTAGIIDIAALSNYINNLVANSNTSLCIYSLGIGSGVNKQLLNLISNNNNGFATFLETSNIQQVVSNFYLTIRNPVLLNPTISFQPNVASEIYPVDLPDLYKGKQMIISGRYNQSGNVNVKLNGQAFGQNIEYNYNFNLSNTDNQDLQFLTKIWAKKKIEHLLVQYYLLNPNSTEAKAIKAQIVTISQLYGVISEFTSFSGGTVGIEEEEIVNSEKELQVNSFEIIGNYPNPFNPTTTIRFQVNDNIFENASIRVYNAIGQLICVLHIEIRGAGTYEVSWNGTDSFGNPVASGVYLYSLSLGNNVIVKKMILSK